ncbi:bifunctional bis(5'-adenosyl)-triphosphatase/adenylylsulfatase FHIT isoform X2 [Physcomitrium patens]|uniref:bifunctional bis(5'-adenosyl)-triphosphatase/adenylylsulfatase FHIT isoform X2 n=1 Tax=Physcomitrium patens TaxID=3218 RepID=UPI000D16F903|nr:bifunctional bis(5'-adenosyl)-triphosphatase/adenylylsulfatase FHIT-like isoform X2 [Physcomitrium patens]|eukprot:XP_024373539.1 bifunctional bis(5'-adenosyl)-triphosphatase/adenylylsulfatase FHIT-like isoform X2 [Physcomitrella patens]
MLSFSARKGWFPIYIFQQPVRKLVGGVWQGASLSCLSLKSGPDIFLACRKSRTLFQLGNLGQPSRILCSVVGRTRMAHNGAPHVTSDQAEKTFYFGKFRIDPTEVFLVTQHSYAFVNLKPVVPGHVLVSPKRVVHRFLDLTPEETSDLWLTAQRVGQKIEPFFEASSLTFAIQDGAQAGQTVSHVHVHILPRRVGDFENNDEVYDVLDEKEKQLAEKLDLDKERKDRTFEEMAAEAAELRALF